MSNKKPRGKVRDRKRQQEARKNKSNQLLKAKKNNDRILKYEHPLLRIECKDVGPSEDLSFIDDLKAILRTSKHGIGISASQIGILKKAFVIDPRKNGNYTVMINAEFTPIKEKSLTHPENDPIVRSYKSEEGCLSYPNFYTKISRPRKIKVKYYDENLKMQTMECEDLKSVLVQHEIEHGLGICQVGNAWLDKQLKMKKLTARSRVSVSSEK